MASSFVHVTEELFSIIKSWPCGCFLKSILMVEFSFPTSSLKCKISVAALPGGMLGARSRLRPLYESIELLQKTALLGRSLVS